MCNLFQIERLGGTQCDIVNNKEEQESENKVEIITKPRSSYTYKMVAALIETMISTKPDTSNKALRQVLSMYGKEYAMTNNLIQQARTYAKAKRFGDTKQNVGYALILAQYLKDMDHYIDLDMTDHATRE